MKNKINSIIVIFLVLTIMLSSSVFAFAVASSYWQGNPVKMYPGERKTIDLRLQNVGGASDETVRVDLTRGSDIASLKETDFLVRGGTRDTKVFVDIKIPSDVDVATTYPITLSFKTITPGGDGVVLGTGYDTSFNVLVIAPEPKEFKLSNLTLGIIIGIILIIIIIVIILKKRKKEK